MSYHLHKVVYYFSPTRSQQRAAYKLKHRLRLSEMWIARCGKELNANSLHSPDTSMIIGWPITNCTAVFR